MKRSKNNQFQIRMAYNTYKPQKPMFRKVINNRGKTIDAMTKALKVGENYNTWQTMYGKDYSDATKAKKEFYNQQQKPSVSKPQHNNNRDSKNMRISQNNHMAQEDLDK